MTLPDAFDAAHARVELTEQTATVPKPCEHTRTGDRCAPCCIPDPVIVVGLRGYYVRSFEHDHRTKPFPSRDQAWAAWDALCSGAFV